LKAKDFLAIQNLFLVFHQLAASLLNRHNGKLAIISQIYQKKVHIPMSDLMQIFGYSDLLSIGHKACQQAPHHFNTSRKQPRTQSRLSKWVKM